MTAHARPATIAQGGRRGPRILTMAYSVSPSGLMRWGVEITWRCSMGRVFDFNTSRLCPAGCCAADWRPPPPAGGARRRRPRCDLRHLYVTVAVRTRTSKSSFFRIRRYPARVATVGVWYSGGPRTGPCCRLPLPLALHGGRCVRRSVKPFNRYRAIPAPRGRPRARSDSVDTVVY